MYNSLLYADDIVQMTETEEKIKNIQTIENLKMEVNVNKTKYIIINEKKKEICRHILVKELMEPKSVIS